jgi:hypothetical protein
MKLSSGQFTTSVKAPYTDQTGGWVVPGSNVAEQKNSCICRKSLQRFFAVTVLTELSWLIL